MKPLYIDGSRPVRATFESSSLRIERELEAPRFLPFRRISRVVASGAVEFETKALLALSDSGIPVSFLDSKGTVRARFIGREPDRGGLSQAWEDFLDRPDCLQKYENWRRGHERRAAIVSLRRLGIGPVEWVALGRLRDSATAFAMQFAPPSTVTHALRYLRGVLASRVEAELMRRGLGRSIRPAVEGQPDLSVDLTRILMWEVTCPLVGWLRGRHEWEKRTGKAAHLPEGRQLVKLFENREPDVSRELSRTLAALQRWLKDFL